MLLNTPPTPGSFTTSSSLDLSIHLSLHNKHNTSISPQITKLNDLHTDLAKSPKSTNGITKEEFWPWVHFIVLTTVPSS